MKAQLAKFKVHVGGRRYIRFATLESASRFCSEIFSRTKIVLAIERIADDSGAVTLPYVLLGIAGYLVYFMISHGIIQALTALQAGR